MLGQTQIKRFIDMPAEEKAMSRRAMQAKGIQVCFDTRSKLVLRENGRFLPAVIKKYGYRIGDIKSGHQFQTGLLSCRRSLLPR